MSRLKTISIFSIILLIVLSAAFALQEDFSATASGSIAACSHTVTSSSILVRNTGDIESQYSISTSGSAIEFATISDSSFSLMPGESKAVFIYYSPAQRKGTYNLETSISTSLGKEKTVSQSIQVNNCPNINIQILTPEVKSEPCKVSQFSAVISNSGDFTETYDLGIKGLEGYTTTSSPVLTLSPGETKQVDFFVNPDCGIYGEQDLTIQAFARTTQYLAESSVKLDIARDYDYNVNVPAQTTVCNLKLSSIPITITNNVPFINQFDLSVNNGQSWMKQEAKRVELAPYSAGNTTLYVQPANAGTFNVDLSAKSVRGDVVKEGAFTINVEDCYDGYVNIAQPKDIIVSGHTNNYPVTIKNEGTRPDTYTIELTAPEWVSLDQLTNVVLKAGESKTINLNISAPSDASGNYKASVKIISAETGASTQDVLEFSIVKPENAYRLGMSESHTRILYGQDAVNIALENKGLLPATYDLSLNTAPWAKLSANSVTLKPNEKTIIQAVANTATSKDAEGMYAAELTATVHNEQVGFVSKFAINLRQITLAQEVSIFFMRYWIFIAAAAVLIAIIAFFAVFGRRIAKAMKERSIRRKELARLKKEAAQKAKEEKLAKRMLRESYKAEKKSGIGGTIAGIIILIIALGILGGAVLSVMGYAPFLTELFKAKQTNEFAPIIMVNTTGLEAYGNTVVIRGQDTIVPVIVKNNYQDELLFGVEVKNTPWIKTDVQEILLKQGEQQVINLKIMPSQAEKGFYKINISATLQHENKIFNEQINLNVMKRDLLSDLMSYSPYLGGALLLLLIIIIAAKRKPKEAQVKFVAKAKDAKSELKEKEVKIPKKISINVPKK